MTTSPLARSTPLALLMLSQLAAAQEANFPQPQLPKVPLTVDQMVAQSSVPVSARIDVTPADVRDVDLPMTQLAQIVGRKFLDQFEGTRSAKDAALYRSISPSVVLIITKDSLGSGSLISSTGDIVTNWHVVKGASDIVVIFKPAAEGKEPAREDIKAARVVRFDPVADLALVKAVEVPKGRNPIRIGDGSDISVGIDVHAIGHPKGES
jgi:S1-C subfamily serine protease